MASEAELAALSSIRSVEGRDSDSAGIARCVSGELDPPYFSSASNGSLVFLICPAPDTIAATAEASSDRSITSTEPARVPDGALRAIPVTWHRALSPRPSSPVR